MKPIGPWPGTGAAENPLGTVPAPTARQSPQTAEMASPTTATTVSISASVIVKGGPMSRASGTLPSPASMTSPPPEKKSVHPSERSTTGGASVVGMNEYEAARWSSMRGVWQTALRATCHGPAVPLVARILDNRAPDICTRWPSGHHPRG